MADTCQCSQPRDLLFNPIRLESFVSACWSGDPFHTEVLYVA